MARLVPCAEPVVIDVSMCERAVLLGFQKVIYGHHVWRPNAWLAYSGSARPRRSRLVTMLRRGLGHPVAGGLRYGCWLIHRLRTGGCSVEQKPGTPSVIGDDGFQSLHRWFYNRRGGMRWVEKKSKDRSWGQLEGGCGRG